MTDIEQAGCSEKIRVLLADDHPLIRRGIRNEVLSEVVDWQYKKSGVSFG